jgi:predicted PurR-regulated permease PerM
VSPSDVRTQRSQDGRSISLGLLATIGVAAALYVGQEVFIPIALGLLFTALFRPLVGALARARIPAPVSATLIVLGCLGLLGGAAYWVASPLQEWVRKAPETLAAARGKLDKLRKPIKQVSEAVEKAQQEVTGGEPKQQQKTSAAASSGGPSISSFLGRVFATTAGILSTLVQTIVIVFLLLATGNLFSRKLALVLPKPEKGTSEDTVEEAEAVIRRYLLVTVLVAAGQGVIVALVFMLLGMPSPVLWGVLTTILECFPYLGALFMVAAVTVTAFATFESIGHILLAPLSYILISTIQNNAVSPFVYGGGLRLNPLVILVVVVVGWFLWGVAGAFAAVPLIAAVRVFAERTNRNSRLAAILSE